MGLLDWLGVGLKVRPYVGEGAHVEWPSSSCDGLFLCGDARSAAELSGLDVIIPKSQMTQGGGAYDYIFPVTATAFPSGAGAKSVESYNYAPLTQFLDDMNKTPGAAAFLFAPQGGGASYISAIKSDAASALAMSMSGGIFIAGDPLVRHAAATLVGQNLPDYAKPSCGAAVATQASAAQPASTGIAPAVVAVAAIGALAAWFAMRKR